MFSWFLEVCHVPTLVLIGLLCYEALGFVDSKFMRWRARHLMARAEAVDSFKVVRSQGLVHWKKQLKASAEDVIQDPNQE